MSETVGVEGAGHDESSDRIRDLEIEVARLNAELDELRGGDPAAGVSRLLTIAVSTIDQVAEGAKREAEAMTETARVEAEEISADARHELEQAQQSAAVLGESAATAAAEVQRDARKEAEQIVYGARREAALALTDERERFSRDVEALTEFRDALLRERQVLEDYHHRLERRVRDLAQAMVSFMSGSANEEPLDVLARIAAPEMTPSVLEQPALEPMSIDDDIFELSAEPVAEGEPDTDVSSVAEQSAAGSGEVADSGVDESSAVESDPGDGSELAEDMDVISDAYGLEPIGSFGGLVEPGLDGPEPAERAPGAELEDPWREIDASEDPAPTAPLSMGPIEPAVVAAAEEDERDLFGPAEPGEGPQANPGSFGRLFAAGVDNLLGRDAGEGSFGEDPDADSQFDEFLAGDEDDGSRSWLLRSEDR